MFWWPMPPRRLSLLTGVNILGVREGKWTQNVLTTAKVLGLAAIVAVGFAHPPRPKRRRRRAASSGFSLSDFGLAMIFVLFTYGGWNEMAFVSAEVKEPRKNILRALLIGTLAVTAIYVLGKPGVRVRPGAAKARATPPAGRRRARDWASGRGQAGH